MLLSLLALVLIQTADVPPTVLTLTVQKLPAKFQQNPVVHVVFNAQGAVAGCETAKSSGSTGIDRVACAQVVGGYSVEPQGGKTPEPRDVTIAFETEAPKN